jgi:hypothetical protein
MKKEIMEQLLIKEGWAKSSRANEYDNGMVWIDPLAKASLYYLETAFEMQVRRNDDR